MKKISDRLLKIVNNEGISVRSLEQKIGCSNRVLAKCIQKGTDISSLWLSKFIEILPKYDAEWLLTGNGDMLNKKDQIPGEYLIEEPGVGYAGPPGCERCKMKDEVIAILRQQVDTQSKLINYLEENKSPNKYGQKKEVTS
ncbi:MAG: hypothetical protein Q7J06_04470 [Bacteroidales bacterium]|nr:hypothetical protein [Bacteroidales bacterium]